MTLARLVCVLALWQLSHAWPAQPHALERPAFPFSVAGAAIVDAKNKPVQMRCANWPGHMETMLPEGIQFAPVAQIAQMIVESGVYNCIRLTYAADMWSIVPANRTARQQLTLVQLPQHIAAIQTHNPDLIDATLRDVQAAVIAACDKQNIAVLLDNQVSHPSWCCSTTDGNGWWNDQYFNPTQWAVSLHDIAQRYQNQENVVAFSLRNELRTSKLSRAQQTAEWYRYVPLGINALHNGNNHALIFVSGLNYDCDLSFLNDAHQPNEWDTLFTTLNRTLVFEAHIYSWSGYAQYTSSCSEALSAFDKAIGYGLQKSRPLVLTEIGLNVDTFPNNAGEDAYWKCVQMFVKEQRLGFGVWLLSGSYLTRDGQANSPDSFGALKADFSGYKNPQWGASLQTMIL